MDFTGTLDGAGGFTLSASQRILPREATIVGMSDFTVEFSLQGSYTLSQVPLPAAAWLFGSGLVGMVGVARRRKRSS